MGTQYRCGIFYCHLSLPNCVSIFIHVYNTSTKCIRQYIIDLHLQNILYPHYLSMIVYTCIHVSVYLSIYLSIYVDFWPKINTSIQFFPTQRPSGRQSLETLHREPGWEIPLFHVAIAGKIMTCIYIYIHIYVRMYTVCI